MEKLSIEQCIQILADKEVDKDITYQHALHILI